MVSEKDLLVFYRQHQGEIDILADEKALFVLALIQQLGSTTLQELIRHLSWDSGELIAVCAKLQNAGVIGIQDLHDPMTDSPEKRSLSQLQIDVVKWHKCP